uniref:Uncharacterized protein n=1 Tax=viral metagenome TaxID=1070528 RepID=A0A6M3LZI1_9ZZZZ
MITADYLMKVLNRFLHIAKTSDKEKIITEIERTIIFHADSRRLRYHRLIFAFMQYLHGYEDDKNLLKFDAFIDYIKWQCGHCKKKPVEVKGEKVLFIKLKSLSFGECGQKAFEAFADTLKQYAKEKYQVDFDEWESAHPSE